MPGKGWKVGPHELEMLALVTALREWRHYLLGAPFVVYTDNCAVSCFLKQKKRSCHAPAHTMQVVGKACCSPQHQKQLSACTPNHQAITCSRYNRVAPRPGCISDHHPIRTFLRHDAAHRSCLDASFGASAGVLF
jgi:hypothetical protein